MHDVGTGRVVAWAPGRVNLIGEHTDYSGGRVLPLAIQYGIRLEAEITDGAVTLESVGHGRAETIAADGSGPPSGGWARYVQAVAAELADAGRPPVGIEGTISSDLPSGSGLSSSAALELAVALALTAVAEFELEPLELALLCQRAELRAVGVPCGILDQAASLLGREGFAVLLDCATLEHELVAVPAAAALLVVDSGVERSLEHTAYARRRAELERALARLGADRSTQLDPADVARLDTLERRRVRHVVTENDRVLAAADALRGGDLVSMGRLLSESHASLRDDYEVSVPELDLLVELADEAGAYGARLLGAGFGGAVLVLTDDERAEPIAVRVASAYAERTGRLTEPVVVRASAGAGLLAAWPGYRSSAQSWS